MTQHPDPDLPPDNGKRATVDPSGEVRGSGVGAGGGQAGEDFDSDAGSGDGDPAGAGGIVPPPAGR